MGRVEDDDTPGKEIGKVSISALSFLANGTASGASGTGLSKLDSKSAGGLLACAVFPRSSSLSSQEGGGKTVGGGGWR